ncbi:hypothetical protein AB0O52_12930 [Arthrobacter sp. NPDC080073]|uniref:hypothetical protein n=1 Tax=Arthrobacter sp. NPDC080073 TaxID=3155919 RepID=UPI0034376BFD
MDDARPAAPVAKVDGVSKFDPLSVVEGQGLVGKKAIVGKARAASNNAQAKLNGRASEVRPVPVSPILNGSRTTTEDGLTVEKVGDSYGAVTGIGQQGLNASYIVINDPAAPSEYKFTIGDETMRLVANADGSIAVNDAVGKQVNYIQPAWAHDATGKKLATSYRVSGNVITQTVDHRGAQYPVTADPQVGCGFGWCSLYFNRWETTRLANGGWGTLGGAAAACAAAGAWAAAACVLAAGFIQSTAANAVSDGKCAGLFFAGAPIQIVSWNAFEYAGPQCN